MWRLNRSSGSVLSPTSAVTSDRRPSRRSPRADSCRPMQQSQPKAVGSQCRAVQCFLHHHLVGIPVSPFLPQRDRCACPPASCTCHGRRSAGRAPAPRRASSWRRAGSSSGWPMRGCSAPASRCCGRRCAAPARARPPGERSPRVGGPGCSAPEPLLTNASTTTSLEVQPLGDRQCAVAGRDRRSPSPDTHVGPREVAQASPPGRPRRRAPPPPVPPPRAPRSRARPRRRR